MRFFMMYHTIKQSITTTPRHTMFFKSVHDVLVYTQKSTMFTPVHPRVACVCLEIHPSTFISTKDVILYLSTLRSIQLCLHSNARFHPVPSRMFLYIPNDFLVMSSSSSYVQFIQVCPHRSFQFIQVCSHRSFQEMLVYTQYFPVFRPC